MATLDFDLSDRQEMAMEHPAQFLLYGGAKGGGKSWFLCLWVFRECMRNRGQKLFFFRKRAVDFINTTLVTWKKSIPSQFYTINENKRKIFFPITKSEVDFGGLDDEQIVEKLNSAEYGGGAIDQAEEVGRDAFAMCRGTLRHRLLNGDFPSYNVRLSANPAQCWLKDDFILMPKKGFAYVKALPTDNPYLPKSYIDNLREAFVHRPELLEAYLNGSWDGLAAANVCIKGSDVDTAKTTTPSGNVLRRIIVNDPARFGDDENVVYVMEETETHKYIKKEIYLSHKSTMDTAGRLAALRRDTGATSIFVDSIGIGSGVVDALNDLNEPVTALASSSKPFNPKAGGQYVNLRAQMWMEAGDDFADGKVCLPNDMILSGQLSSITFDFKANGRIQVEGKEDIKKRLARSPDRADAFVMGLHGLRRAPKLDEDEFIKNSTDRQGMGKAVEIDTPQDIVGLDYSGYGM